MSLIAHYPLNGDTKDMLGNYNGTASNVTWVDGKLGQAGSFTSSSNVNITPISIPSTASFCAWAYMTDSTSGQMIFSTDRASGSGCDLYFSGGVISWNTGDGNNNPFRNNGVNVSYPIINTWHHYTVVNDMIRDKAVLYLNGSYYGEANWRDTIQTNRRFIIGNYNSGTAYAWRGLINDVRIYDHALSPKEIKEIAKAKVLHYKFDDPYEESTTNLINPITASWVAWGGKTGNSEYFTAPSGDRGVKVTITNGEGGVVWFNSGGQKNVKPSTVYTVSGTIKYSSTPSGNLFYIRQYRSDGTQILEKGVFSASLVYSDNGDGWKTFYSTFTTTSDCAKLLVQGYEYYPREIYLHSVQLEEKDHATPFTIGTRQGTIRDCSGFRNDGTVAVATAPSWSEDTPVGSGSMEFDGGKFITLPNMIGGVDQITVCAWFKSNGSGGSGYHIIMGGAEVELDVTSAGEVRFGLHVNNVRYVHNYSSGLTDGKYHHICGMYDGSVKSIYVDGVLVGSYPVVGKIKNNITRRVGVFGTQTNYHTNGNISDVRIYATALSASDIKDLYELRGSIESNGTFWAEDLSETEAVTSGLKSSGTLEGTELIETGYSPSLIDYSTWKLGESDAVGFSRNGLTSENIIESNINPWGDEDVVWAARNNDTASGADGGFNGSTVPIDRTKTHRFSIWIRRAVSGNGTWYFGCSDTGGDVESLSGSPNGNPYFSNGGSVFENEWFLLVGYVYPTGTTTNLYDDAGIYDVQGKKLGYVGSFRCGTGTTHLGLRSYLYYSTQPSTVQFFYRPRIDVMDTSAPTLRDILTGSENQPIIHQYGSSGQYENEYSKINTNGKVLASDFNEV